MTRRGPLLALLLLAFGCKSPTALPDAKLRFLLDGKELRTLSLTQLAELAPPAKVPTDDPYYGKAKTFRAIPLQAALAAGLRDQAGAPIAIQGRELVFRAKDGYSVPMTEALATEDGAWLAFADEDTPGYEPIGPQHVSPFPFYLIWSKPGQNDLESHPRPWQLEAIELVRFDVAYPHTAPPPQADADADARARRGQATFRAACFKCHAINREGGRTGPELNVPRNVFEYLPAEYIRSYVRNPADFRYGIMPAHRDMPDAELDDLLFYVRSMQGKKFDPARP